jgi:hypothetical protein
LLTNGDFETNDFGLSSTSGYSSPAPQNNRWYSTDGEYEWKKVGGDYRIENEDGQVGFATAMHQTLNIIPGKEYKFTGEVGGMALIIVSAFDANDRLMGFSYNENNSGIATISTSYTLPGTASKASVVVYLPGVL